ncbi:MAG: VOC family protein [Oscillospiraceae bacterium]|jgi:lactoylglutathione lyase|nr:VOC family protein [Oscillospiraceae bacterium]
MQFSFGHVSFNVLDLEKSLAFYTEALGLSEVRRRTSPDNEFTLVFLGDGKTGFSLELTYIHNRKEPYDLGENEMHVAFIAEDLEAAHKKHLEMGCVCFENEKLGIYFIEDPDGYWLEIVPQR